MKKLIILSLLLIASLKSYSQISKIDTIGRGEYCSIMFSVENVIISSKAPKIYVKVDFGDTKATDNTFYVVNGEKVVFRSVIHALNVFYQNGWEVLEKGKSRESSINHPAESYDIILRKRH